MLLRNLIVVLLSCSLMACTSMKMYTGSYSELADEVAAGDHVMIRDRTGRVVDMRLTAVSAESLTGTLTGRSATVVVPIADIERIDIERVDGLKTSFAVVGGVAFAALVVAGAEAAAISSILSATP